MKINKSKYRILVVKDQGKYSQAALQNAVNLAKKIGGSIDLLHVKSPSRVVGNENQLAAWRELNRESARTKKTLLEEVNQVAANERIPITCNFTFGNLINEVQRHINATQPDIVVLAERKTWLKNLLGIDLTSYLLENYQGALLISKDEQALGSHHDLSLGLLDDFLVKGKNELLVDLEKSTAKPITLLKINTSANEQKPSDVSSLEEGTLSTDMTTFEFDHGANIGKSVSKYIEMSGVSLLCVSKSNLTDFDKTLRTVTKQIQKTNTPVLVL